MVDLSGPIDYAMSWLLALMGRVGILGLSVLGWLMLVFGVEWSVSLIQKVGKAIFPGATYEETRDQELQDLYDFHMERDELAESNKRRGLYDLENQ